MASAAVLEINPNSQDSQDRLDRQYVEETQAEGLEAKVQKVHLAHTAPRRIKTPAERLAGRLQKFNANKEYATIDRENPVHQMNFLYSNRRGIKTEDHLALLDHYITHSLDTLINDDQEKMLSAIQNDLVQRTTTGYLGRILRSRKAENQERAQEITKKLQEVQEHIRQKVATYQQTKKVKEKLGVQAGIETGHGYAARNAKVVQASSEAPPQEAEGAVKREISIQLLTESIEDVQNPIHERNNRYLRTRRIKEYREMQAGKIETDLAKLQAYISLNIGGIPKDKEAARLAALKPVLAKNLQEYTRYGGQRARQISKQIEGALEQIDDRVSLYQLATSVAEKFNITPSTSTEIFLNDLHTCLSTAGPEKRFVSKKQVGALRTYVTPFINKITEVYKKAAEGKPESSIGHRAKRLLEEQTPFFEGILGSIYPIEQQYRKPLLDLFDEALLKDTNGGVPAGQYKNPSRMYTLLTRLNPIRLLQRFQSNQA